VKLPFGLKLIAVITIIGGLEFIAFDRDWLVLTLGAAGIAVGVGLLLRRKWAWLLAIAITASGVVFGLMSLAFFFRRFYNDVLLKMGTDFRVVYLCFTVAGYVYSAFCLYYLIRPRTRLLFGVGSPSP
jgi:hypothetical protein